MAIGDRRGNSVSTARWGWQDIAVVEQREREISDPEIVFAGQGRNRDLVHLVSGASKGQNQPHAVCGLWVSNKWRMPLETEKVCSKCVRGGTSFGTYNQPRTCVDCGRRFADSATRDSNDALCPDCYDRAGTYNEHVDGGHKDVAADDCPDCAERIHAEGGHETEPRLDWCDRCVVEIRTTNLVALHAQGEHATAQLADCPTCSEEEEQRQLAAVHSNGGHDTEVWPGCLACADRVHLHQAAYVAAPMAPVASIPNALIEHRRAVFSFHIDTLAAQLRGLADEAERQGSEIADLAASGNFTREQLQARALTLAGDLLQLPGILDVPSLITEAGQLAPEA
jgi:hypothetical protein